MIHKRSTALSYLPVVLYPSFRYSYLSLSMIFKSIYRSYYNLSNVLKLLYFFCLFASGGIDSHHTFISPSRTLTPNMCILVISNSVTTDSFRHRHIPKYSLGSSLIISSFLFFRSLVKNDSLGNFDYKRQRHLDFSSNSVG